MALPPMKADLKETITATSGAGGYASPFDSMMPWSSIKNYSNHSTGANQSASATSEKSGGSVAGGLGISPLMLILIGAAIYILKR